MPSKDEFHEKNPLVNRWLTRDDASGKLRETTPQERQERRDQERLAVQAARVQALAAATGVDAETLASRIPDDTLRRLKFPVIEQPQPDGTAVFKHDIGIQEGVRPLLGVDRAHEAIPPGSGPQPRDDSGRFTR